MDKSRIPANDEGSGLGFLLVYAGWTQPVYAVKSHDLVTASPAKSRQRKRVMYELIYSNATWHTDWHVMKDPRMNGLNPITHLDDASRCVTGAELFREAASENAVTALRRAVGRFGVPATILSGNGSCFGLRKAQKTVRIPDHDTV